MDTRDILPIKALLYQIAQLLLFERVIDLTSPKSTIDKYWTTNFIRRHLEL
jgi:hypothetical protein